MLPFGVTIPTTVLQRSEIPEGLMNYPVYALGTTHVSNKTAMARASVDCNVKKQF